MHKKNTWDGVLDISYKKQKDDVFYYNVHITFGKKKVHFTLPRYHPMVGWIEVFGLPPQNEWVFLDNEKKPWKKTSPFVFEVNNKKFKMSESLEVFPDFIHKRRSLELIRKIGATSEVQWYEEDWSKMEKEGLITRESIFKHTNGHYFTQEEVFLNPKEELLNEEQRKFIQKIRKIHGDPKLGIWLKRVKMRGAYPPLYAQMFPFWGKDILEAQSVEYIELGYEVAQKHGAWYKLCQIVGKVYEIEEDNYTERKELYKGKLVPIKNSYRKKIRKI